MQDTLVVPSGPVSLQGKQWRWLAQPFALQSCPKERAWPKAGGCALPFHDGTRAFIRGWQDQRIQWEDRCPSADQEASRHQHKSMSTLTWTSQSSELWEISSFHSGLPVCTLITAICTCWSRPQGAKEEKVQIKGEKEEEKADLHKNKDVFLIVNDTIRRGGSQSCETTTAIVAHSFLLIILENDLT